MKHQRRRWIAGGVPVARDAVYRATRSRSAHLESSELSFEAPLQVHPALRNVFPRGTPEEDRLFKLLKHAYVDAHYDPKFAITREELETIAVHVRQLRSRVEKVCRERIEAMEPPRS